MEKILKRGMIVMLRPVKLSCIPKMDIGRGESGDAMPAVENLVSWR